MLAEQRLRAGLELHPDEPQIISLHAILHARRNESGPALDCVRRSLEVPITKGHAHTRTIKSLAYTPYSERRQRRWRGCGESRACSELIDVGRIDWHHKVQFLVEGT